MSDHRISSLLQYGLGGSLFASHVSHTPARWASVQHQRMRAVKWTNLLWTALVLRE